MFDFLTTFLYANSGYGLGSGFDWIQTQGQLAIWIILIILLVIVAAKRAWSMLITIVIFGGVVLFFINNPSSIGNIGEFVAGLFGVN